jgi:DNA-binding transcriptional regulator LsrR (DeoR family)
MSWGSTLLSVVDALPAANFPDIRVVQIIGGLGELEANVHGAELTRRMAQTLGARPRLLHAPGIVKDQSVRDALVSDPQVSGTLELAAQAQIALVGLGELREGSTLLGTHVLAPSQIEELKVAGAVGDVALRFFDRDGNKIDSRIDAQIVGLDLDSLKAISRVIGVAGGGSKFNVVRAALLGKLISVLITDCHTAQRLLEDAEQ